MTSISGCKSMVDGLLWEQVAGSSNLLIPTRVYKIKKIFQKGLDKMKKTCYNAGVPKRIKGAVLKTARS